MEAADVHERKTFGRYFLEKKQAEGLPSPKKSLDFIFKNPISFQTHKKRLRKHKIINKKYPNNAQKFCNRFLQRKIWKKREILASGNFPFRFYKVGDIDGQKN